MNQSLVLAQRATSIVNVRLGRLTGVNWQRRFGSADSFSFSYPSLGRGFVCAVLRRQLE
jgi:hypothetical protein